MTKTKMILLTLFLAGAATAAGVAQKYSTDILRFGIGSSTDSKQIVFDTADGGSNPTITVDMTQKEFSFNKALNIVANQLKLGDGVSTDQVIVFDVGLGNGNPRFRYGATDGALQFANDGVNFRNVGAGSGGGTGVNLLADENADLEAGSPPQNFVAAGTGTFLSETTNPLFGDQSGLWDPAAAADTISSSVKIVEEGFFGRRCQVAFDYRWQGLDGEVIVKVLDENTDAIISQNLKPSNGTVSETFFQTFPCPTLATGSLRWQLEATADTAGVTFDNVFLGTGRNEIQITQTELYAEAYYPGLGGCFWGRNGVGFAPFTPEADCVSIVQTAGTGVVDVTDNDKPDIVFRDVEPGIYTVEMAINADYTAAIQHTTTFAMWDSVTGTVGPVCASHAVDGATNATSAYSVNCRKTVTVTTPQDLIFELYAQENNTGTVRLLNSSPNFSETVYTVTKQPLKKLTGVNFETSAQSWSAIINDASGDAFYNIGTTSGLESQSTNDWVMTNTGALPLEIACASGETSAGNACAGAENLGFSITPIESGRHEMCIVAHPQIVSAVAQGIRNIFYMAEYSNDSTTQISKLPNVAKFRHYDSASGSTERGGTIEVCNTIQMTAGVKRTFLLLTDKQVVNASPSQNAFTSEGVAGMLDHFFRVRATNKDQQLPSPVFPEITAALSKALKSESQNDLKIEVFDATCDSSSVVNDQTGGLISITNIDPSTGACSFSFSPGIFSTKAFCSATNRSSIPTGSRTIGGGGTANGGIIACRQGTSPCTTFRANVTCIGY